MYLKLDTIISRMSVTALRIRVADQGLEPQYHPPEGCVLPLDESALLTLLNSVLRITLIDKK